MKADSSILSNILNHFNILSLSGSGPLKPVALWLFGSLILIDIILAVAMNLGSPDAIKTVIGRVLKYGFLKWVIENWSQILGWVLGGFTFAGGKAANNIGDCNALITDYLAKSTLLCNPLINHLTTISILDLPTFTDLLIPGVGILIFLTFLWIVVSYIVTMIEFNIVATLSLILIPFGGLKQTAFIAQKVTNGVVNFGIKVMVLTFLMHKSLGLLQQFENPDPSITFVCYLLVASLLLAFLSCHAPSVIATLLNGTPSMSAGTVANDIGKVALAAAQIGGMVATGGASGAASAAGAAGGGGATAAAAGGQMGGGGGQLAAGGQQLALGPGGGGGGGGQQPALGPGGGGGGGGGQQLASGSGSGGGGGSQQTGAGQKLSLGSGSGGSGGGDGDGDADAFPMMLEVDGKPQLAYISGKGKNADSSSKDKYKDAVDVDYRSS